MSNHLTNFENSVARLNCGIHNYYSLGEFLFSAEAYYMKAEMNFNDGNGYHRKNMVTETVVCRKYSPEEVVIRFPMMKDTKEIVLNLATGI